jgi:hypothetical protein
MRKTRMNARMYIIYYKYKLPSRPSWHPRLFGWSLVLSSLLLLHVGIQDADGTILPLATRSCNMAPYVKIHRNTPPTQVSVAAATECCAILVATGFLALRSPKEVWTEVPSWESMTKHSAYCMRTNVYPHAIFSFKPELIYFSGTH